MKVGTWNVNSLRARLDGVLDWLEAKKPDVLCLQETKISDQEFPIDQFGDVGYDVVTHGDKAYAGVALASRHELTNVTKGWPEPPADLAPRIISADVKGIRFTSVYVPNGQSLDSEMYTHKLEWMGRFRDTLEKSGSITQPQIIAGDMNLAPLDIDVWSIAEFTKSTHVSEPERAAYRKILELGLTDAWRHLNPTKKQFTYWDYRAGYFHKGFGMRIDHVLLTAPLVPRLRSVLVDVAVRRGENPSDHTPVLVELE